MEVLFEFNLENACYTIVNIDMKLNKIEKSNRIKNRSDLNWNHFENAILKWTRVVFFPSSNSFEWKQLFWIRIIHIQLFAEIISQD